MTVWSRTLVPLSAALVASLTACGAQTQPSEETRTAGSSPAASTSPAPTTALPSAPSSRAASASPAASPSESPSTARRSASASPSATRRQQNPRADDLVTGLTSPWGLVPLADGSILVSERDTGKIKQVTAEDGTTLATLSEVEPAGEGGLLGLALSADAKTVFTYFTAAEDNRIVAMSWDGATLGEPRPILTGIPKGGRHNGGRMVLGPDGYLYVGTGEVGETGLAQDKESLGGKILRITVDGKPAPGNPFDSEVWSYGHRNVQGLAFDGDGQLWASEFGEQTWDELNLITKGGNYGWPEVEGSGDVDGMINPKVVWKTSEASPAGLAYWQGELWVAALRGARLWEIPIDGKSAGDPKAHFTGDYGRLRSVAVSADGDLLLSSSNTDGRGNERSGDDRILRVTR